MSNILVVSAHPSDALLGCGGTLRHHMNRGDTVSVLVLGDGWTSRVQSFEQGLEILDLDALEAQERAALATLGVSRVEYCRLPDNRLDNYPLLELVKRIERSKHDLAPSVVYTNSPGDLSVDQRRTCQAVVTAFRPTPCARPVKLFSFEVPSSTEWNAFDIKNAFKPNYFIDIDGTLEMKLQAMAQQASEIRPWPHPRSMQAVEHLARWRGASVGLQAAEAFVMLRTVAHHPE